MDGANYSQDQNFLEGPPDAERSYCNTCYALLGYLAETISGKPFERLSQDVLFSPLGMEETGWFLRDLEGRTLAMPYRHALDTGFVAYGHNGYPDWPAGQLRSSIRDMAHFLSVYAAGGESEGESVIDPNVIDVLSPPSADVGFHTWTQRALRNGEILYSHGGGDIGVSTVMAFRRRGGRGVIVLTNGEGRVGAIAEEIFLAIDSLKTANADPEDGGRFLAIDSLNNEERHEDERRKTGQGSAFRVDHDVGLDGDRVRGPGRDGQLRR